MSFQLPRKQWKYNDWIDYIIERQNELFSATQGKQLKIYYVHSNDLAKQELISHSKSEKQGDFRLITMNYDESASGRARKIEYWMHEKEPGLLMFFTVSTKEGYARTLRDRIDKTHGLHEMWIKPHSFEIIREFLIVEKKYGIVKFLADRKIDDKTPQRVKENAERHIQYRTDHPLDGVNRLQDLKYHLGVRPRSIDYVAKANRLQITDEGLFHLKSINKETFELMDEVLEKIRAEEKEMRLTSQQFRIKSESMKARTKGGIVESGKLILERELDVNVAQQMTKHFTQFAFVNTKIEAGSLIFSSTVIDRKKGSIFALSANENSIVLVPRFMTTFESFLQFYKYVVEQIDANAVLTKFDKDIESR